MSDYVNNKLLDASPLKRQKEESQKLVAKMGQIWSFRRNGK